MQRPRASSRKRSANSSKTRSAFGSRTRYAPRRPMSFRAGISPPPTTGMPSSSMRRDSIASTSRYKTAIFDFAITMSSVDEYPRVVKEPISRHAAFSPSSNPFRKAFRFSSPPIPVGGIRPRRAYRDFAVRSADVPEVLALVRGLRRGLDVFQLRGDLVDLLRLRLEFVERDLDPEVLREYVEHGLRGLRVDEVPGRLAHEADGVHVVQAAQAEEQAARADDPCARLPAGEHNAVLLHLLHVMHLVVDELDLPVLLHEDLGREVLREDLRELDRLQLVLQVFRGELADVPDAGQAFDARRIVELRVVEVPDHDVVHGVSSLQFVGPLKFAPVHAVPVFRRIAGRHRVPRRMAARRANRLKRVPAARAALLEEGPHPLSPSGGTSPHRLSRSRLSSPDSRPSGSPLPPTCSPARARRSGSEAPRCTGPSR